MTTSTLTDRTITCADCGKDFTWTVRDQEFYAQKHFTNPPKRCGHCREKRRDSIDQRKR
jgi:hypothetical protein